MERLMIKLILTLIYITVIFYQAAFEFITIDTLMIGVALAAVYLAVGENTERLK